MHLSLYLDELYVEQLRVATTRLKKRHAIVEAWRAELDRDFGTRHEVGLVDPLGNIGFMSEYDPPIFFGLSHPSDVRLFEVAAIRLTHTRKLTRFHMCVCRVVGFL